MKLLSVTIKNYRSIDEEVFELTDKNKSQTYTLIGINESGKSSFLSGIALVDEGTATYPRDYYDEKKPIEIVLKYELTPSDVKILSQELNTKGVPKEVAENIEVTSAEVGVSFDPVAGTSRKNIERISFTQESFSDYFLNGNTVEKKAEGQEVEDLTAQKLFESILPRYFFKKSHHITFWKSDPKHLIGEQINLETFSKDPEDISIPLYNCFNLAEIEDIDAEIQNIKDDTSRRQNLQDKLGDSVTAHIKKVWPNHPIKIKFNINNMLLEFLIEDDDVKYKTKTTGQRSDGFKQFISFLLTISAEHATSSLSRSLLLLDEPETHLHPKAQEFLKDELIGITKNNRNNIVFFATHSSYMIDRDCIDRCYKVEKKNNNVTKISEIKANANSYAEVNYEVFDILSSDYHNELYGIIQEETGFLTIPDLETFLVAQKVPQDKDYIQVNKDGTAQPVKKVTLPTYIRNMIHHPENTNNPRYTDSELAKSIKTLRKVKNDLP